jgi:hypothetical protein
MNAAERVPAAMRFGRGLASNALLGLASNRVDVGAYSIAY